MNKLIRYAFALVLVGAMAVPSGLAATDARWTNDMQTGLWNTPGNWSGNAVPNSLNLNALFSGSGTSEVTLDTETTTQINALKVSGGKQVVIRATENSVLSPCGSPDINKSGFVIDSGAVLTNLAPVSAASRIDKWGTGTLASCSKWSSSVSGKDNAYAFIFGAGTNDFYGAAELDVPDGWLCFGNGARNEYSPTFLRDQVKINAHSIKMAVGAFVANAEVFQEGDGTEVCVTNQLHINSAGQEGEQRWTQRAGKLAVRTMCVGNGHANSLGTYRGEGGTCEITNALVNIGAFEVAGGNVNVGGYMNVAGSNSKVEVSDGSLTVVGRCLLDGVQMNITGGEVQASGLLITNGASVVLSGGTFNAPDGMLGYFLPMVNGNFKMRGGTLVLHGIYSSMDNMEVDGGGLVIDGTGKRFTIDHEDELTCVDGSYQPFGITVKDGNTFSMKYITSRVTAPLDLVLEGTTSKVTFPSSGPYNRSILVAHRLRVNGEEKAKGRYAGSLGSWFDALPASTIVVPYVWTGAAGDGRWSTAGNWDGNEVPPSNATSTCVDISRASDSTITLDGDVTVSCIIMNGTTGNRKTTIAGNGHKLNLGVPNDYSCAMFVGPDRELVLDVDVAATGSSHISFLGGGRVTVKRGFIDSSDYISPKVSLDVTLAFSGNTSIAHGLSCWTHEQQGNGIIRFDRGGVFSAFHVCAGKNGFYGTSQFIQDGATVTLGGGLYMTYSTKGSGPFRYTLNSGDLTLGTGVFLGNHLAALWTNRGSGGDFYMDGGTMTAPKLSMEANQNHYYLYGGTINLGKGGFALEHSGTNLNEYKPNSDHVYLGGVTINSTEAWNSALNMIFNRNYRTKETVINTADGAATLNGNVSGEGILRKLGANNLTFSGTNTMSGKIIVDAGALVFGVNSMLDGEVSISSASDASLWLMGEMTSNVTISAARFADIYLPENAVSPIKKLVIGGVTQPAGTYALARGKVTVADLPSDSFVWTGASGGNWLEEGNWTAKGVPQTADDVIDFTDSILDANAEIGLNGDISLKQLVFGHPSDGATLTIGAAGGAITFPNNARIDVANGCTVIFECDVKAASYLYKYGPGKVIFRGKLRSETDPETATTECFMCTKEGTTEIQGEVECMRLWTDQLGLTAPVPQCVIGEGAVITNRVSVNMIWDTNFRACVAKTVQNGGIVDMASLTPGFGKVKEWGCIRSDGGIAEYVLNDGYFAMATNVPNKICYQANNGGHTFSFVQNGGTSLIHNLWMGDYYNCKHSLILNGGTMHIGSPFYNCVNKGTAAICLNGGTLSIDGSGTETTFPSYYKLSLGGEVELTQNDAAMNSLIPCQVEGEGTITQDGLGTVTFSGNTYIDGSFVVEQGKLVLAGKTAATNFVVNGGTLTLSGTSAADVNGNSIVSIDSGAKLELDGTGEVVVKRLTLNGRERPAGVYGAQGKGQSYFAGNGTLRVTEGESVGMVIILK